MLLLERGHAPPFVFHADDGPAVLLRLVVQGVGERADLAVGQSGRRTIRIFAILIRLGPLRQQLRRHEQE